MSNLLKIRKQTNYFVMDGGVGWFYDVVLWLLVRLDTVTRQ